MLHALSDKVKTGTESLQKFKSLQDVIEVGLHTGFFTFDLNLQCGSRVLVDLYQTRSNNSIKRC